MYSLTPLTFGWTVPLSDILSKNIVTLQVNTLTSELEERIVRLDHVEREYKMAESHIEVMSSSNFSIARRTFCERWSYSTYFCPEFSIKTTLVFLIIVLLFSHELESHRLISDSGGKMDPFSFYIGSGPYRLQIWLLKYRIFILTFLPTSYLSGYKIFKNAIEN